MPPDMRGSDVAKKGDRQTAWEIVEVVLGSRRTDAVTFWMETGSLPPDHSSHSAVEKKTVSVEVDLASLIASKLMAERHRTALEVSVVLGRDDGVGRGDHVRVLDPHSRHYGKSGLVRSVRDGRVMISMAEPRSIGGAVSDSFLPEHLERLEDPAPVNLERAVLLRFMRENAEMSENLTVTQERCTVLLLATRSMRQKIVELGGEDPGPA